jgi:hypothetical protein
MRWSTYWSTRSFASRRTSESLTKSSSSALSEVTSPEELQQKKPESTKAQMNSLTQNEESMVSDFRLTVANNQLQEIEDEYNIEKRFDELAGFKKLKIEANRRKTLTRKNTAGKSSHRKDSSLGHSFEQQSNKDDSFIKKPLFLHSSQNKLSRGDTGDLNGKLFRSYNPKAVSSNERLSLLGARITEDLVLLSTLQGKQSSPAFKKVKMPKRPNSESRREEAPKRAIGHSAGKPKKHFDFYQERYYFLNELFLGQFDLLTSKRLKIKIVKDKLNCEKKLASFEKNDAKQKSFFFSIVLKKNLIFNNLWKNKKEQIRQQSAYGHFNSYSLKPVIIKGGDDLRQELFAMQLIKVFDRIFKKEHTGIYLRSYEIIPTSHDAGFLEFLTDTIPISSLKKKFNSKYTLAEIYKEVFKDNFEFAQKNFIESLAGYCLLTYLLQIKDRHNGNIMITHEGHIVHIDFGFILAMSPGNITFESAPFKFCDVG